MNNSQAVRKAFVDYLTSRWQNSITENIYFSLHPGDLHQYDTSSLRLYLRSMLDSALHFDTPNALIVREELQQLLRETKQELGCPDCGSAIQPHFIEIQMNHLFAGMRCADERCGASWGPKGEIQ